MHRGDDPHNAFRYERDPHNTFRYEFEPGRESGPPSGLDVAVEERDRSRRSRIG
ncbi:hypothetical protein HSB1_33260 [Halogranum salarium B-1]|uniref:Uncharacterized protein n=1 Tax=Halogranum salarium B-1 TaxID=1210908 RepID=J3JDZ1_9EURY|nr:hypothetical protein HSB1_33260 [Halogranum salarium B-1]